MANVYYSPQNGWVLLKLSETFSIQHSCVGAWTNGTAGCRVLGLLNSFTYRFAFVHHSPVLTTISEDKLTQFNPVLARAWKERHGVTKVFRRGFLDPENEWGAFRNIQQITNWVLTGAPQTAKLILFMTAQNHTEADENTKCLEYMRQLMKERAFVELRHLPAEMTFSTDAALIMQRMRHEYHGLHMNYYPAHRSGDNVYVDAINLQRYPLFFVGQNEALFGPEFSAYMQTVEGASHAIESYEDYEFTHNRIPMMDVIGDGAVLLTYDPANLTRNLNGDPEILRMIERLRENADLRMQFFSMPYVACVKSHDNLPAVYRSARSILLQRWGSLADPRFPFI